MSGDAPIDTVGPWTLKAVPTQTRQAVIRAAQRENLTVGQWLERRVREWTEEGSAVVVSETSSETRSPPHDLDLIERAVTAAVALAGAPDVPKAFRQRANRLLREALPQAAPRVMPGRQRALSHSRVRACRVCGCTDGDCSGCIERTGEACHWVASDLCSACVGSLKANGSIGDQAAAVPLTTAIAPVNP
jgi:hypothetical protein